MFSAKIITIEQRIVIMIKTPAFAILLFGFLGCGQPSEKNDSTHPVENIINTPQPRIAAPIEDGIYLILNEFMDSSDVSITSGRIIPYSHDFLEGNREGQALFFEVDTSDFVGLNLSEEPEGIEQPDERLNLMLTLTDSSGLDLERFSEKNIDQHICIVIGGAAVTSHKVREKVIGGKLQITRCTDNACEHLLLELKDNYNN